MLYFSTSGHRKDTLNNVEATGKFVANFAGASHAQAMNATAASVARGVDKFALAGLTPVASVKVRPPRVDGAIAAMECRFVRIFHLTEAVGTEIDGWMVIGKVVGVHIDRAFLRDGIFDTAAARLIARCGSRGDCTEVNSTFEMIRPA